MFFKNLYEKFFGTKQSDIKKKDKTSKKDKTKKKSFDDKIVTIHKKTSTIDNKINDLKNTTLEKKEGGQRVRSG